MSKKIYGVDEKIPGESAYDRCSYKGCKNGRYRMGGRKLFLFPSHTEPERRERWLNNCGNDELRYKADSSIRRSGVCSDHFDSSCFTDGKKNSLKRNSIPRINYPQHPEDRSAINNHESIDNNPIKCHENVAANPTVNNTSDRLPKLFVDDDYLSDDRSSDFDINYENSNNMQKKQSCQLNNEAVYIDEIDFKSKKSAGNSQLSILDGNDESHIVDIENSLPPTLLSNEKQMSVNTQREYVKVTTSMSTIELLRTVNEDQNKDRKIDKLIKQNMLLRRELKTLKQNVRRWEQQRQSKWAGKKPSLKQ